MATLIVTDHGGKMVLLNTDDVSAIFLSKETGSVVSHKGGGESYVKETVKQMRALYERAGLFPVSLEGIDTTISSAPWILLEGAGPWTIDGIDYSKIWSDSNIFRLPGDATHVKANRKLSQFLARNKQGHIYQLERWKPMEKPDGQK